jgi:O-antigen ligase
MADMRAAPISVRSYSGRLGLPFILLLGYLVTEYVRPQQLLLLKTPMLLSAALFLGWLVQPRKHWSPQLICFFLFLGVIAAMGPFAVNTFWIFHGFVGMTVQLLCIGAPLMHFVDSIRKVRIFLGIWLVAFAYLAVYGLTHAGTGPGAHLGDENDLALALNIGIPIAFAFMLGARTFAARAASAMAFVLMVGAVAMTFSRGGFLGLAAVLLYCFFVMMRQRALSLVFVGLAVIALHLAPADYHARLYTIVGEAQGTEHGTGEQRQEIWALARRMFYANPILGVGLYNFAWNVDRYQDVKDVEREPSYAGRAVHSLYYSLLAELGSTGGLLFGLLIWYTLRDTHRVLRLTLQRDSATASDNDSNNQLATRDVEAAHLYAHALRAALIGFTISGAFLSVLSYPHFWLLVALAAALHESTSRLMRPAPLVERGKAGSVVRAFTTRRPAHGS